MSERRPGPQARARCLVIDGDRARGAALAAALSRPGAEVETSEAGEVGWRRFTALRPSVVVAGLGGERDGGWFLRRMQTDYMGASPAVFLVGDRAALDRLDGLSPTGFVLPPLGASAAAIVLSPAATGESEARQAMRLRELFELSLFGGQLRQNLEAVVRLTALSFRADDCAVWTADGSLVNTIPYEEGERAGLFDACRLACRLGAPLIADESESCRTIVAVAFDPSQQDGGLALCSQGRRFSAEERDALALLARRLGGELAWMAAHQRVLEEAQRLREAAMLDPMLGVMNRAAFEQAVEVQLGAARRTGAPVSLALIDVCGTRAINERHGHQVGDAVLIHAAQSVRQSVRVTDPVGRVGGDELGVLFVGTAVDAARQVLDKLLTGLSASPCRAGGLEIPVAAAAGLTSVHAEDRAEPAMSRARDALRRVRKAPGAIQVHDDGAEVELIDLDAELGLPAGTILGGMYRILHELSRGSMGVVYRAEDLGLGRSVAIKLLRADLASDRDLVARFRREAGMLASLHHTNLVQVYALGADADEVYFVMELVEGESVSDILMRIAREGSTVDVEAVARIVEEVADALEAIHALGIVHRDVKPANVLLDRVNERTVLVDVGVARRKDEAIDAAGTPGYGAPECFLDVPETPASDVYGLAATAYAMLTGRAPFSGGDLADLVARQLSQQPRAPSSLRAGLSPAVDAVLFKALAGRPEDRFASAPAFAIALTRALTRERGEDEAPPSRAPAAPPPTTRLPTTRVAAASQLEMCRGAFFCVTARLLDRELGASFVRGLGEHHPTLARAFVQATPSGWLPLADLCRIIELAGPAADGTAELAHRIGRATISATLARHFGADPATLSPPALLKAAENFWSRYHNWGRLTVGDPGPTGLEARLAPAAPPLVASLMAGSLSRIAEMAGADEVDCAAIADEGGSSRFRVSWAG